MADKSFLDAIKQQIDEFENDSNTNNSLINYYKANMDYIGNASNNNNKSADNTAVEAAASKPKAENFGSDWNEESAANDTEANTIDISEDDGYTWGEDFSSDFDKYAKKYGLQQQNIGDFMLNGSEEDWRTMYDSPEMRSYYADNEENSRFGGFDDYWDYYKQQTLNDVLSNGKDSEFFSSDNETIRDIYGYLYDQGYTGGDGAPYLPSNIQSIAANWFPNDENSDQVAAWLESVGNDRNKVIDLMSYMYAVNAANNAINNNSLDSYRNTWNIDDINKLMVLDEYEIINDGDMTNGENRFNDYSPDIVTTNNSGYFYEMPSESNGVGNFIPVSSGNDVIKYALGDENISYRKRKKE